jgi:excisionase family DNA binding protein
MPNEFILVKDAADYLDVSTRTIQRYIKAKKVKFKSINGKLLINKDSLESFKEVTEASSESSAKSNGGKSQGKGSPISFDWQFIKDSLEILRDQLRSKDDQIKELTNSVKELQMTQKLLIERGMNLRQLPEERSSDVVSDSPENKISIDQSDMQPKVINVQIKNPEQATPEQFSPASSITINPVKKTKNYTLAIIITVITVLVIGAVYMLYNLSVKTPY